MTIKIPAHIFREYDIRGTVGVDLSEDFAYLLGRAYATLAKEHGKNNIAVGHDCRLTSPAYAQALVQGLNEEGISTLTTGMGPTPQLYYAIFKQNLGGGIQVTGSHNPADMNGFKICLGTHTLSGEQIQDLRVRMEAATKRNPSEKRGSNEDLPIRDTYINELIENIKPHLGKRKLKIVVDAGNGVGGLTAPRVLRGLGVEVVELYCETDGRFPNHHPDPTVLENIKVLRQTVRDTKADFGIGLDGDADRIGVVDQHGDVIFGDMLLLIFAREILKEKPGATIIGDVKCSDLLFSDLRARGGNAIMWKTGHSLIKGKLYETGGVLAGEMSAHIFFKHRYYGFDDAVYAGIRLVEIMSKISTPLSSLLSDLPRRISTPEIRVDCPEEIKFKIVSEAQKKLARYNTDTTDGVRVTFDNGWGLVRASNTQPVLVMRFEADTQQHLDEYQKIVTSEIEQIKAAIR
jgi:phosphomannomutase/phosphoglucomutase